MLENVDTQNVTVAKDLVLYSLNQEDFNNLERVVGCLHAIAEYCIESELPYEQFECFTKEYIKLYKKDWPFG